MLVHACVVLHNLFVENFYDIGWNDAHGFNMDKDNVEHTMFKRLSMVRENSVKSKNEYINNLVLHHHGDL
jgi:hypothetical protein